MRMDDGGKGRKEKEKKKKKKKEEKEKEKEKRTKEKGREGRKRKRDQSRMRSVDDKKQCLCQIAFFFFFFRFSYSMCDNEICFFIHPDKDKNKEKLNAITHTHYVLCHDELLFCLRAHFIPLHFLLIDKVTIESRDNEKHELVWKAGAFALFVFDDVC